MEVEIIDYTKNGIDKVARMSRSTRLNKIEEDEFSDFPNNRHANEKFVRALINVEHLGILEHITFTFHVSEISRITSHQLVRHRMASYLQMSSRHAKPGEQDFVIPNTVKESEKLLQQYNTIMQNAYEDYNWLMNRGVPIEDARYVLPPAFFTHISMTMNARSLRHFLELRLAREAQWEIRELACKVFDIVYTLYPVVFEDLKELRDKND